MVAYRDASDGKLKIRYGDLWKVLATIAVIVFMASMYKSSIDSNFSKLDYTKVNKDDFNKLEQTVSRMDEKMNFIYDYLKSQKEGKK